MKLTISLRNKIHTHTHTHTEQCGALFMGWKLEISEKKEFLKTTKKRHFWSLREELTVLKNHQIIGFSPLPWFRISLSD